MNVKTLFVFAVAVGFHLASRGDGEFVFADHSRPKAAIIVAQDAPKGVKYAANELAKYVNKMTRAYFPVTDRPIDGWNTIRVGGKCTAKGFDAIDIRVSEDGRMLDVTGESPRAVVYAVYDLLETLGCGFWTPNSETVPLATNLTLAAGYVKRDAPAMRYRSANHYTTDARFMLKLRGNELKRGSEEIGIGPGEYENIMHSLVIRWIPRKKFFKTDPEWFALVERVDKETGEKKNVRINGALCMTNPEMRAQLLKEIDAFFEKNYPRERSVSLSPSDMGDYCHCPNCTALIETDANKTSTVLYLDLIRFVSEHFRERYPEATFNLLSYWSTAEPPANTKKWRLPDNCGVGFAALWRNHGFPIDCCERFAPRVKAWKDMSDRFIYWDYYANFSAYLNPFPNLDILGPAFRFYRDNGFIGGFAQMPHTRLAPLADLNWYLMGKLMWNPDADVEALTDAFVNGVYGRAAPAVRRYMEIVRHAKLRDRGIWIGCYVGDTSNFLTPEDVIGILRAFDDAERRSGDEPECVREAVWRLRYAGIHTAAMRYPDLIEPAKRLKYELRPWPSYTNEWYSYIADYRNRLSQIGYPQLSRENTSWKTWGDYFAPIMANGSVCTSYPAKTRPTYVLGVDKLTGGTAMSRAEDAEGPYAKLTFGFGGGEKIFMNPKYAEVGCTVSNELTGTWMVLARLRVGSTIENNPAAAYMGIYSPWIVNGARIGRTQGEIASMTIPSSPGEDGWRWVTLGAKTLYEGARIWVMPGVLAPTRFLDVQSIAFVDPVRFAEKSVGALGGKRGNDEIDKYSYRTLDCTADTNGFLSVRLNAGHSGKHELFARVRVINGKVLDASAGRLELWRVPANKGDTRTLLASRPVFGSAGEEVWQTVSLGRVDLKAGDEVRFVRGASGNALALVMRDVLLVDCTLLDFNTRSERTE